MRYELTDYEWHTIKPFLPNKPRGVPRVNDWRVLPLVMPGAARNAPTVLRHRARPGLIISQPWQRFGRALHTRAHILT